MLPAAGRGHTPPSLALACAPAAVSRHTISATTNFCMTIPSNDAELRPKIQELFGITTDSGIAVVWNRHIMNALLARGETCPDLAAPLVLCWRLRCLPARYRRKP